jgi:putative ATPase
MRSTRLTAEPEKLAAAVKPLLAKNGNFALLASPPRLGERISRILRDECGMQNLASALEQAEEAFFDNMTGSRSESSSVGLWDSSDLTAVFEKAGFSVKLNIIDQKEERLITEKDLSAWFNIEQSRWGSFMAKNLEKTVFSEVEEALRLRIAKGPLLWLSKSIILLARM